MDENNDEYRVGYCKPPKHTQWQPGQSGNPRGRPKKSARKRVYRDNHAREFLIQMDQEITIWVEGQPRKMVIVEAVVHVLVAKALGGNLAAIKYLLDRWERFHIADEKIRGEPYNNLKQLELAMEACDGEFDNPEDEAIYAQAWRQVFQD